MAMLPFVLFSVTALLISQLLGLQPWWPLESLHSKIQTLAGALLQSFPLVLCISISIHSANMFGSSLSLAVAATLLVLFSSEGFRYRLFFPIYKLILKINYVPGI